MGDAFSFGTLNVDKSTSQNAKRRLTATATHKSSCPAVPTTKTLGGKDPHSPRSRWAYSSTADKVAGRSVVCHSLGAFDLFPGRMGQLTITGPARLSFAFNCTVAVGRRSMMTSQACPVFATCTDEGKLVDAGSRANVILVFPTTPKQSGSPHSVAACAAWSERMNSRTVSSSAVLNSFSKADECSYTFDY